MQVLHRASNPTASAVAGGVLVSLQIGDAPVQFVLSATDAERLAAALQDEAGECGAHDDEAAGGEGGVTDIGARVTAVLGGGGTALGWLE